MGSKYHERERSLKTLLELLSLERRGQYADIIALRTRLQGLHGGLYTAYMATR